MKVMQVLPQLNVGGVERGTVDLALFLKKNGHDAVVVSSGGRLVDVLEKNGIKHYTLAVDKKCLFTAIRCIKELKKIIEIEQPDIVHGRSRVPDWICLFAVMKSRAKLVITAHGCHSKSLYSSVVNTAKVMITPSNTAARYFTEKFLVDPAKIKVIPRGLLIEDFKYNSPETKKDMNTIAFVGRLSPFKGVEYLIDAVNELVKKIPQLRCIIVGEAHTKHKNYEEMLKKKVQRYGIDDNVVFAGYKKTSDVLDEVKVLVLPALVPETFGRVIIEGAAKGCAVVSSDLGAPKDMIDNGRTGLLVPAFDASCISSSVLKILEDEALFSNISRNARSMVEQNYTLEHMCSGTLDVYKHVLSCVHILVFKLGALGDVVLATAGIRALKEKYPDSRIDVVVYREFAFIYENLDFIDRLIILERKGNLTLNSIKLGLKLFRERYDISVDFQNNRYSQILTYLSQASKSIGVKRKYGFVYDSAVRPSEIADLSPIESQKYIMSTLNINKMALPYLKADDSLVEMFKSKYKRSHKYMVGINVSASVKWKTKNPNLELYKELVAINSLDVGFVLFGANKGDAFDIVKGSSDADVIDLCGKTSINELIALEAACDVVITPDSAPFHIALALGVPSIVFFGPTDSRRHFDNKSYDNVKIMDKKMSCAPCYKKICPDSSCMSFSAVELYAELKVMLKGEACESPSGNTSS